MRHLPFLKAWRTCRVITLALAVGLAVVSGPSTAAIGAEPTGLEIMRTQRRLHEVQDEHVLIRMRLVGKQGSEKLRTLSSYTLRTGADRHKILLRFLAPPDIADTGLLVWESGDGDDDQWLYLPSVRRARRIPPSSKKNPFMGTDFAYEDMRPEALLLHTYARVRSEVVDGIDTFVVEARPASPEHARDTGYSRRMLWIQKDTYVGRRIEYHDRAGRLLKVLTLREHVNVGGTAWRADETEMHDVQAGTRTIMRVERRTLNQGLPDHFFTEAELRRGGR